MNNLSNTPSHHVVGEIAKKKAIEFQPSIKRWLTKATSATQPKNTPGTLGACIANTANNKNVNNESVVFENRIRSRNEMYNAKLPKFKKTDEMFKMVSTNVNLIQTFPKRQRHGNFINARSRN